MKSEVRQTGSMNHEALTQALRARFPAYRKPIS